MRIAVLILFAFVPAFAAPCSSTSLGNGFTCVVSASAASTGASTGATTSGVTTSGNFIVGVVAYYSAGSGLTITDNKGNGTPTFLTTYGSGSNQLIKLFYWQNATTGSGHTFSCAGTTVYCSIAILDFSGVATSSAFNAGTDKGNNSALSASTVQPGSITPPGGAQLIVTAASAYTGGLGDSVDSSVSLFEEVAGASGLAWNVAIGAKSQATGTAINPTWSQSGGPLTEFPANIASFNTGTAPPATAVVRRWYGQGRE